VRIGKAQWAAKLTRTLNETSSRLALLERGAASILAPHRRSATKWERGILAFRNALPTQSVRDPWGLSAHKKSSGMPDTMTDRRVAPRYPLVLLAEVTDQLSTAKFTARTSDVSRTGCYIDMLISARDASPRASAKSKRNVRIGGNGNVRRPGSGYWRGFRGESAGEPNKRFSTAGWPPPRAARRARCRSLIRICALARLALPSGTSLCDAPLRYTCSDSWR
jgi:hypothetical protein